MIKNRYFNLVMFMCLVIAMNLSLHSQELNEYKNPHNILPLAPNTSAFSRYGTYPVNLSSGLVDISIPLYTIKSGKLELPVSLSYHGGGVKVQDISSTIGLGWSLNAGGMISIQVKGHKDSYGAINFPDSNGLMEKENRDKGHNYNEMSSGDFDTEKDLYFYSAPGLGTGRFTYNYKATELIQIPETDNQIIDLQKNNEGIIIISENGTKYYFTTIGSVTSSSAKTALGSYLLSKIESADAIDYIEFEYYDSSTYTDNPPNISASYGTELATNGYTTIPHYSGLNISFTNTQVRYSEAILTKIKFKGGEVLFDRKEDREDRVKKRHTGIRVMSTTDNSTVYSCEFLQDYFESTEEFSYEGAKKEHPEFFYRLSLTGIKELSSNNKEEPRFHYFYYNSTALPAYDCSFYYFVKHTWRPNYPLDECGYYNGAKSNYHLLTPNPSDTDEKWSKLTSRGLNYPGIKSDRKVSDEHMRACSLEKIVYPTGASTHFKYRAGYGGLTIGGIYSFDKSEKLIEQKEYQYNSAERIDFADIANISNYFMLYFHTGKPGSGSQSIYSSNPFLYKAITNTPYFYTHVTEYFGNAYDNFGKKEYIFQNKDNEVDHNPGMTEGSIAATGKAPHRYKITIVDNHWRRGNLLSEEIYKKVGEDYELVQRKKNSYKEFKVRKVHTGTVVTKGIIQEGGDFFDQYIAPAHRWFDEHITTGVIKLMSTETQNYIDGKLGQSQTEIYNYDKLLVTGGHQQLTRKSLSVSGSDSIITKLIYPQDISIDGIGSDATTIKQLLKSNVISHPIEILTSRKKNNTFGTTEAYFYQFGDINQIKNLLKLNTDIPLQYHGVTSVDNNGFNYNNQYQIEISYLYNKYNRIKEYRKRDDLPVSILWGYKGIYPIIEAKGISYNTLSAKLSEIGLNEVKLTDDCKSSA